MEKVKFKSNERWNQRGVSFFKLNNEKKFIEDTADRLLKFMDRLKNTLEGYQITRLEHSLQTATRAFKRNS